MTRTYRRGELADCHECPAGKCDDCGMCRYFTAMERSGWTASYGFDDAPSVYDSPFQRLVARFLRLLRWLRGTK